MGLILNAVAEIELWQGIVVSAAVVTVYTYIGGMWAITITDFIQTIIIIGGLLAYALTGVGAPWQAKLSLILVPAIAYATTSAGEAKKAWLA